jgi:hypothetical protein
METRRDLENLGREIFVRIYGQENLILVRRASGTGV